MPDAAIDPSTFEALREMGGAEFVDELVQTFFEEAPRMLADLHAAAAGRDAERFRRAAHSFKSNGMTFGALRLGAMAKALELDGMGDAPQVALAALAAEYARVVTALRSALQAPRDG